MAQSDRPGNARRAALLIGVVAGLVALRRAGLTPVRVVGESMEPTLPAGALVAVARPRRDPAYGAVVVVRRTDGSEHLKRVVAVPSDRFRMNGGPAIVLGPDQYAVAGDHRARSTDSRQYGPVRREEIVAVARVCYWPPRSWRLLPR